MCISMSYLQRTLTVIQWWVFFCPCCRQPNREGVLELSMGGVFYCLGVVFFKSDGLVPFAHAIWHIFVVIGAAIHYYAIWKYLYATGSSHMRSSRWRTRDHQQASCSTAWAVTHTLSVFNVFRFYWPVILCLRKISHTVPAHMLPLTFKPQCCALLRKIYFCIF